MSHILLKKVPTSSITTPGTTDVKFFSNFNDNGLLYYLDSSGAPIPVGGTPYVPVVTLNYSSLYSLYTGKNFATASYYLITDFESIYEQPDFYFDGTPRVKSTGNLKNSASGGYPVQPLLVQAISCNSLSPIAYQPKPPSPVGGYNGFPMDKIKYDVSWNKTEFNHAAKGRIIERIDDKGNRTDYDHRTIKFKRYQSYVRDTQQTGTITDFDCFAGNVAGSGGGFSSLSTGDIILLDTWDDLGYDIGLKVQSVTDPDHMIVEVDSLYQSGLPSSFSLLNGSQIIPINYSFTGKNFNYWSTSSTGNYSDWKQVYFGQSDANDFQESYTFTTDSKNNVLGDWSFHYLQGDNNSFVLGNNVFNLTCENNTFVGSFGNNHIDLATNNTGNSDFYGNTISTLVSNIIQSDFFSNTFTDIYFNRFYQIFRNNYSLYDLKNNDFKTDVKFMNLTSESNVSASHNCEIFRNSAGFIRLSYYDSNDVLHII